MKNNPLILIFILFAAIILFACTDEEYKSNNEYSTSNKGISEIEVKHIDSPSLRSLNSNKYSVLGAGYDAARTAFDDHIDVRSQIIDIERYLKSREIKDEDAIHISNVNESYGKTYDEYLKSESIGFNLNFKASLFGVKLSWFNTEFSMNSSHSNKNVSKTSYHKYEELTVKRRIFFDNVAPSELKKYLTPQFVNDLKVLSASEIVNVYGTHVLTDVLLGGKLSIYASAEVQENEFNSFLSINTSLFSGTLKGNKETTISKKLLKANYSLLVKTYGGDNVSASYPLREDGYVSPDVLDYSKWSNSLNTKTGLLIGIGRKQVYPISEFIDDYIKKVEVETAINEHLFALSQVNYPTDDTNQSYWIHLTPPNEGQNNKLYVKFTSNSILNFYWQSRYDEDITMDQLFDPSYRINKDCLIATYKKGKPTNLYFTGFVEVHRELVDPGYKGKYYIVTVQDKNLKYQSTRSFYDPITMSDDKCLWNVVTFKHLEQRGNSQYTFFLNKSTGLYLGRDLKPTNKLNDALFGAPNVSFIY